MSAQPFTLDGVDVIPRDAAGSAYAFVPGEPGPEVTSSGDPTLLLLEVAGSATLQFGTRWDVTQATLDRVRSRIARERGCDASAVQLGWAAIVVDEVSVELRLPSGASTVLATGSSAQYPPFAAIFNIPLAHDRAELVKAALGGARGILSATYHATLRSPASPAPIERSTDLGSWYASRKPTIISA